MCGEVQNQGIYVVMLVDCTNWLDGHLRSQQGCDILIHADLQSFNTPRHWYSRVVTTSPVDYGSYDTQSGASEQGGKKDRLSLVARAKKTAHLGMNRHLHKAPVDLDNDARTWGT